MAPAVPAAADTQTPLSEAEMDRRLAFISQRLNEGRPGAQWWQYGWSGFFGANTALQGYLALRANNADKQSAYTVDAVKSGAALTLMLLRPLPAVKGDAPIQAMPAGTRAEKAARLQAAENLLRKNAARAEERTSLPRHMAALAVNFVGGTAIAAFGDFREAVISNMTGIALSQAHIWSQPARAIDDLEAYEERFPGTSPSAGPSWHIQPIPGGLSLVFRF